MTAESKRANKTKTDRTKANRMKVERRANKVKGKTG